MKISKKNFLSLVQENLNEMPMDFNTPDRPDQELQNKLSQNDTPITKVPLPKTGHEPDNNFQQLLASESYKQVVENIRRYVNPPGHMNGVGGNFLQLSMLAFQSHNTIIRIERQHLHELEELAVKLVMDEMSIPEGKIEFDVKIVQHNEINAEGFTRDEPGEENPDEVNTGNDEEDNFEPNQEEPQNQNGDEEEEQPQTNPEDQEIEEELYLDLKQLNLERAKRRLINTMIQGASKKGHFMYHLVAEKLRQLTGSDMLLNNYGIMMSINDAGYWQLNSEQVDSSSNQPAGKEGVERPEGGGEEGKAKVVARAINFPVLLHEIIKGVMELFAIHGQPQDPNMNQAVAKHEDTLDKEVWDLRLGPAIWNRIRSQFPEDVLEEHAKELQNWMLVEIFKLPPKQFLILMKEVISNSDAGKRLMLGIMRGVNQMMREEDYEETMNQVHGDLDQMSDEEDEGDLKSFLNNLGIDTSGENDDENDDDEGGELVPVRR